MVWLIVLYDKTMVLEIEAMVEVIAKTNFLDGVILFSINQFGGESPRR